MKHWGKKGSDWIFPIIIAGVIALVFVFFALPWLKVAFEPIEAQLDQLGDCDKDRVPNFRDKCPCITTLGNEEKSLPGCPLGTPAEVAQRDQVECSYFITDDQNTFTKDCQYKDEDRCELKCSKVEIMAAEVDYTSGKGIQGRWDVTVTSVQLSRNNQPLQLINNRIDIDLNQEDQLILSIQPTIQNRGSEQIYTNFYVGARVCADEKRCVPAILSAGGNGDRAWVVEGLADSKLLEKKDFIIGKSDACAGSQDNNCFVEIFADINGDLRETDETNNKNRFYVALKNKRFQEVSYRKFQIKVIVDNNEGPIIDQYFEMGDEYPSISAVRKWHQDDGYSEFENIPNSLPPSGNCWILGEDDDVGNNNLGAAAVSQGTIISNKREQSFTQILGRSGDDDAYNAIVGNKWKADGQGSLICKQGNWNLCETSTKNTVLEIGNKQYTCNTDFQWI
jgi:hypothetical protein